MATVGKIREFNPQAETFSTYIERLELYFEANGVAEEKKVAMFLTLIGARNYTILKDAVAPEKPKDKSLEDLVKVLKTHFDPKPIVIAERFHFHKRVQHPGESLSEYVAELRRLATNCDFGTFLDDAIRDCFICGLNNESTQQYLLAQSDLTSKSAVEKAINWESAQKTSGCMKQSKADMSATSEVGVKVVKTECYRCGRGGHSPQQCRFKDAICNRCNKKGHIKAVCKGKRENAKQQSKPHRPRQTRWIGVTDADSISAEESDKSDDMALFTLQSESTPPILVHLQLNGQQVSMELDTGAAMSLISETTKQKLFPSVALRSSEMMLKTYTAEQIEVVGEFDANVIYENQRQILPLLVIKGAGPSLIGRNWLGSLRLNWGHIKKLRSSPRHPELDTLLNKYQPLFDESLGTMKNFTVKLELKPEARPKFCRPRSVPFALKGKIDEELERLEKANVIVSVPSSDWATPIVAVPKPDGKVRICGDYKITLNPTLEVDRYPLPSPESLFATLSGGRIFSKIDLSHAYQQVLLDNASQELVTITTHRGLYRYTRLPFGVASAPSLFQRIMDTVLRGLPNVICYLDDILVTGKTQADHLKVLEEVFRRLQSEGISIKRSKCSFMCNKVQYLGHIVDAQGIHTSPDKVKAILEAPAPHNVSQLRSLLGLVNYYGKFIPNLASILYPLNQLLKKGTKWKWSDECKKAFQVVKQNVASERVLVHYDTDLPLRLATDASSYGLGAVISHVYPDGNEHPIAFASRTLTPSEKNYSQIEKEALSLTFGIKKFHNYVYARKFTLVTDNKPLSAIMGPKKGIPVLAASRLQRWAILLSAYNYDLEFRPTKYHSNADALSRLPLSCKQNVSVLKCDSVFNISQIEALPLKCGQLAEATSKDVLLAKVMHYTRYGWPNNVDKELLPFYNRKCEISIEGNCLMWGIRVIIPHKYQKKVLQELHSEHPGMTRMKAIARSYAWWPGMNADIESMVKACISCQQVRSNHPKAPLNPWPWPNKPWSRLHIDFAGPLYDKTYLVVIDAYSKWPEVVEMSSTTASKTIEVLRQIFATHGIPDHIVSDNGPQFIAKEFESFVMSNGIKHLRSAPYHPATNGLVERFVQTLKRAIVAGRKEDGRSSAQKLASFLLKYRSTPHASTGTAPCILLYNRPLKTVLDLMKPMVDRKVLGSQTAQKFSHDQSCHERQLEEGDSVMVKNYRDKLPAWIQGIIVKKLGNVTFMVKLSDRVQRKCHIDQLRKHVVSQDVPEMPVDPEDSNTYPPVTGVIVPPTETHPDPAVSPDSLTRTLLTGDVPSANGQTPQDMSTTVPVASTTSSQPRYPQRNRKPPDRYC